MGSLERLGQGTSVERQHREPGLLRKRSSGVSLAHEVQCSPPSRRRKKAVDDPGE